MGWQVFSCRVRAGDLRQTGLGTATAIAAAALLGVLVGTLLGERVLLGLPVERFRRIVSALVGLLGIWLLISSA